MINSTRRVRAQGSLGALALALLSTVAFAAPALAQAAAAPAPDDSLDTVVITGTSIRGVNPVGSNLISVTRADLDKTNVQSMQQIYKTIPALSNMGALPQGNTSGNAYYAPTIHNLGSSSSNSTLVLIDGHRFSLGSQQQPLSDPGIVPAIAIQRVEVLADGASSVYGSDAVAGVVNFVTRKNYEGFQMDGQAGFADGYHTLEAGILWGERWSDASLMLAGNYSYRSILKSNARDSLNPDHSAHWGGTNFNNTQCEPAQIVPNNSGGLYYESATATTPVSSAVASRCNTNAYSALAPSDMRLNGMVKFEKNIGDRLTMGVDYVYSDRMDKRPVSRGTINGTTVFAGGAQANPFYTNPTGDTTATSQKVYYDADALLGPGAYSLDDAKDMYIDTTFDYNIDDNWHATFLALYGSEDNNVASYGTVNGSAANLALNGTTNSTGSTTTVSVPGTTQLVLQYPLTTANALDVWNPAATNRTSQAVKNAITDNGQTSVWYYSTQQYRGGLDGTLFSLPGGDVHAAVGAEYVHYTLDINKTSPNNTGPASTGSAYLHIPLKRTVRSANAEILVPIVSPEMTVPFVNKLTVDISGRYDDYSDVGETANPKYAVDWEVVPGFKLRGNYASSFVAPELSSIGDLSRGGQTSFTSYAASNTSIVINPQLFPAAVGLGNCTATVTTCTIPSTVNGVSYNGSPANPKPSTGKSWSLGFDVAPSLVPGLTWGMTYFNTRYINAITGTSLANATAVPSLGLIQFFPAGLNQAQVQALVPPFATAGNVSYPVYYVLSTRQNNVLNLGIGGIDSTINYHFDTDNDGGFDVGADISSFLLFRQHLKGGPSFSVLGSTGYNNTFGSVPVQSRFHLGWDYAGFGTTLYVNYISGYHNYTASAASGTPVNPATGLPAVNLASVVNPSATIDLHLNYTFTNQSLWGQQLGGSEVFVDFQNLLDHQPSFYNSSTGYDGYTGNPIGRLISFGFRARM